ncbi:MAG: calcium/proton exchanger [Cyanobacteria bacterium]|nr:calcium/proton exchanger [Cyanobacteriota bacterium]
MINFSALRTPLLPLLVFIPLGLVLDHQGQGINPLIIFLVNGIAIVPIAQIISQSVEQIAEHLGDNWGGILNSTLGNLVELVIAFSALTNGLYEIVLDSMVGGLVTNLLLVLGLAALFGGLKNQTLPFKVKTALLNSKLLLAVVLVSFVPGMLDHLNQFDSQQSHEQYSIILSIALLVFYALSFVFQFSIPKDVISNDSLPNDIVEPDQGKNHNTLLIGPILILSISTLALVFSSEALVDALSATAQRFNLSAFFTGVFLLPLFGSASEFVVSVRAAQRNRMDLAVASTVGSSVQIILFVLPVLVLFGAYIGKPLGIFFSPQAMVAVIVAVFSVEWVSSEGELDWFEGSFLLMVYLLLLISSFYLL